jgi:hypothetical protein
MSIEQRVTNLERRKQESSIMRGKDAAAGDRETCLLCFRTYARGGRCANWNERQHRIRRAVARLCARVLKQIRRDDAMAVERRGGRNFEV